jgi:hypothetical protein
MHLTNKEPIRSDLLAASGFPDAAGAPADEIEITPEMIEAGAEVIWAALDGVVAFGSDTGRMWARLVFEAMAMQSLNASKLTTHRCLSSLFAHDID